MIDYRFSGFVSRKMEIKKRENAGGVWRLPFINAGFNLLKQAYLYIRTPVFPIHYIIVSELEKITINITKYIPSGILSF